MPLKLDIKYHIIHFSKISR